MNHTTTKLAITAAVRRKLASLERHQRAVKRLIEEVEQAVGFQDGGPEDENTWQWGMHVDGQGSVCPAKDAEKFLRKYLALTDATPQPEREG